jgi:hypothetical protein
MHELLTVMQLTHMVSASTLQPVMDTVRLNCVPHWQVAKTGIANLIESSRRQQEKGLACSRLEVFGSQTSVPLPFHVLRRLKHTCRAHTRNNLSMHTYML